MRRRTLISGLAALGSAASLPSLVRAEEAPARACKLITQDVLGPYHVEHYADRSDIREDEVGLPLTLDFDVVASGSCAPLPGAKVTIWHCNREGLYSGVRNMMLNEDSSNAGGWVDMREATFLRGVQTADENGRVRFVTVFPGWYYPRQTHLHLVVQPPDFGEVATTQLYFRNEYCDAVYATEHYVHRGPSPSRITPETASPTDSSDAADLWPELHEGEGGLVGRHQLGVSFYGDAFGELPDFYRQG